MIWNHLILPGKSRKANMRKYPFHVLVLQAGLPLRVEEHRSRSALFANPDVTQVHSGSTREASLVDAYALHRLNLNSIGFGSTYCSIIRTRVVLLVSDARVENVPKPMHTSRFCSCSTNDARFDRTP